MRIIRTDRCDEQAVGAGSVEVWSDLAGRSRGLKVEVFVELECDDRVGAGGGSKLAQEFKTEKRGQKTKKKE